MVVLAREHQPTMPPSDSIILPAYNEAERLPAYLTRIRDYCDRACPGGYEVLVVDDGSTDATAATVTEQAEAWPQLRLVRHEVNRGKGAAVRTGMLAAAGERLLMADADGATPIEEHGRLAEAVAAGADLAVGSRLIDDSTVCRRRSWSRGLLGRVFAAVARRWLRVAVRDTQCGFKMFRRETALDLFSDCRESGYLFDLELLALAQRRGYRIDEVPISWCDVPGGHLHIARELPKILAGLWRLRDRRS